jgi:MFS family permease
LTAYRKDYKVNDRTKLESSSMVGLKHGGVIYNDRGIMNQEEPDAQRPGAKLIVAALVATSIEWLDFFAYGFAAALVFGEVFFPSASPLAGVLASFATFAVGFLARPVGGLVFGHFGDNYGRKPALVTATVMMGVATFFIGVLPSYAAIGVAAPILLTLLRIVQGFSVGGQWGGATLLLTEHSSADRRGLYGSLAQAGVAGGLIPAISFFLIVTAVLSPDAFAAWGWRIPFLASAVLIGVGLYIQVRIEETPAFRRLQGQQSEVARNSDSHYRSPVLEVLRTHPKPVLLAAGAFIGSNAWYYFISTGMVDYATRTMGVANTTILTILVVASFFHLASVIVSGTVSDRVGRRPVYLGGAVLSILWTFPLFWLANTASLSLILVAITVGLIFHGMMYGPQSALYAELFNTKVRYSGASVGYQAGAVLGGGFAPLITAALFGATGTTVSISLYLMVALAITFVSVYVMSETAERRITPEAPGTEAPQTTRE